MHPDVKKLLELQKVDQEIASLRRDLDSLPEEERKRRSKLDGLIAERDRKHSELQAAEVRQSSLELTLKQADQEISKLNERLNTVKNNAEYQATLFQIESVKRDRDQAEEEGLVLLDQLQVLRAGLEETQKAVDAEQEVYDGFRAEAEKVREERQKAVDAVAARRAELAGKVSPELVEKYERIFQVRGSLAVCAVENQFCQGCYTNISTNDIALLMGGKSVIQCGSCQRILYLPE